MSTSILKGNRTRYRNLLEKELEKGKKMTEEAAQEQYEQKVFSKSLNNCIKRLNEFTEKLEQTNERLSIVVDGQEGAQEVEQFINQDWSYISEVIDCRDELIDIQRMLQDQRSPTENVPSVTVTEDRLTQMIQVTAQMQQVLISQQQLQQQQQHDSQRLMSKLSEQAKTSVSGIQLSNENYAVAVELLKERYGDTQAVVTSHYTELINLKSAPNNPQGLRNLYNQIERHLRSLKALAQDTEQEVFISMITAKLPKEVRTQLELQKGARTKWTVSELRERFNDYISARERSEQHTSSTKTEDTESHEKPMISSAEALVGVQIGKGEAIPYLQIL